MENQRRYFRLDVVIGFEAKTLNEPQRERGIARLKARPDWYATMHNAMSEVDGALEAVLGELRQTAPRATTAIELLNQKIDLMRVGMQLQHRSRELPLRRVNLSASGLAFEYKSALPDGTSLYCALTLPSLGWYMELYARVVSSRQTEEGRYMIGVDFDYIREEDREQLIRFNLQQQQESLVRNTSAH